MLERHGANHGAYRSVLVGGRKSSGDKVIWRHSDRKALWRLGFRDVRESPGTSGTTALFPWHARGQGFKSPQLHQPNSPVFTGDSAVSGTWQNDRGSAGAVLAILRIRRRFVRMPQRLTRPTRERLQVVFRRVPK